MGAESLADPTESRFDLDERYSLFHLRPSPVSWWEYQGGRWMVAGYEEAVAELCRQLLADPGESFYVRQQAARCIARHGSATDRTVLAAHLDTAEKDLRRTLHFVIAAMEVR